MEIMNIGSPVGKIILGEGYLEKANNLSPTSIHHSQLWTVSKLDFNLSKLSFPKLDISNTEKWEAQTKEKRANNASITRTI